MSVSILDGLPELHPAPFATNNGFTNFCRCPSIFVQLFSKENLLETDRSTRAVVGPVTIKQAAVTESATVAIAGLLHQHTGDLLCY